MSEILVITGARRLCDTPRAVAWGKAMVHAALTARPWTHVMHGGAFGPDTWAHELALRMGIRRVMYGLDGGVYLNDAGRPSRWWTPETRPHPLSRNREIVRSACKAAMIEGNVVCAAGFAAPWAFTHGTDHTLGLIGDALLPWWRVECPREYGP